MPKNTSPRSGLANARVLLGFVLCSVGGLLAMLSLAAPTDQKNLPSNEKFKPVVIESFSNGLSRRVSDLPLIANLSPGAREIHRVRPLHPPQPQPKLPVRDPVQQTAVSPLAMPTPIRTFDGMNQAEGCGGCIPPDMNGAVGRNHYVEMVNSSYSVYSKTGTRLAGPVNINLLWANLPGLCQANNDGDPVVIYDHLADRWVLTQFAVPGPYDECIAVSATPDPTGAFYVYDFRLSNTVFHDYPHLGVWPDGYYMSTNEFDGTSSAFLGAGAFAFERDKILLGQPARLVFFDESTADGNFGGQLPAHLDGPPPPTGSPNYFAQVDSPINSPALGPDALRIWKFHVDWANTANSTFGLSGQPNSVLPVAMWTPAQCVAGQGTCVPQMGSPYQLDVLGDRLMFRLAYRNFGDHEALVANHSVVAGSRIGVRWYEVRNPGSSPTVFQQSTFAPTDSLYRWMGSIAMDRMGNIAVGYSTSSATTFPSIAYAGRLATDPLNQLAQGEAQMFAGLGPENVAFFIPPEGRWGDYSDLTVDPTDGCTFYYVNEYFPLQTVPDPGAPWRTRIGSFKFGTCVPAGPVPTAAVSRKIHGTAGTFDISLPLAGTAGIECRDGGPSANYQVVVTFPLPVTLASANVSTGTGTVSSVSGSGNQVFVNLANVANAQNITITLVAVNDGTSTGNVVIPMSVLLGDTTGNRVVNASDIGQAKAQSGQAATSGNFRTDVNVNGTINASDISLIKSKSGTQIP